MSWYIQSFLECLHLLSADSTLTHSPPIISKTYSSWGSTSQLCFLVILLLNSAALDSFVMWALLQPHCFFAAHLWILFMFLSPLVFLLWMCHCERKGKPEGKARTRRAPCWGHKELIWSQSHQNGEREKRLKMLAFQVLRWELWNEKQATAILPPDLFLFFKSNCWTGL